MWTDLWHFNVPPLELAIRAVAVYLAVILLLRIAGKRQLGQMSPTEFVAVLLISNAVQNSMNGGDNSLAGGLLLAFVLILTSWAISLVTFRSGHARMLFEGAPTLVIHKGMPVNKSLERERITHNELRTMLRKQGIDRIDEVHTAVLEADGSLSVVHASEVRPGASSSPSS